MYLAPEDAVFASVPMYARPTVVPGSTSFVTPSFQSVYERSLLLRPMLDALGTYW